MFHITLGETRNRMSYKAVRVKIQWPKNQKWGTICLPPSTTERIKIVLVQFRFTTSEIKLGIQFDLVNELSDQLQNNSRHRMLGNHEMIQISQILVETQPSVQSSYKKLNLSNSSENVAIKICRKIDIKTFQSSPVSLDFFTLFQIFFPRLPEYENVW